MSRNPGVNYAEIPRNALSCLHFQKLNNPVNRP